MVFARKRELATEKLRRAEDELRAFRSNIKSNYEEHKKLVQEVNSARKELLDLETSLWPEVVKDTEPHQDDKKA